MLVMPHATTLVEIPEFLKLHQHATGGTINAGLNSPSVNRLVDESHMALLAFRKSLGLPTNVRVDIVRMHNSTHRSVVGAIVTDGKLKSFDDNRFYTTAQIHIDATMCILSWSDDVAKNSYHYPHNVSLGSVPLAIPDNLKDKTIFFKDDIFADHISGEFNIHPRLDEAELKEILFKLLPVVIPFHKEECHILRQKHLADLGAFVHVYGLLLGKRSVVGHPTKYRLGDKWMNGCIASIKQDLANLPVMFHFVKRCFYLLSKEGFLL